jgi:hypothetical protein
MTATCLRLSQVLIAAALFAGTQGVRAQAAEDTARDVPPATADAPSEETSRQSRRQKEAGEQTAKPTTTSPRAKSTKKEVDPTEVICKYDQLPGTKVKRKVCGTAEQWATWRKKSQDNADEVTRQTREAAGRISRPDLVLKAPVGGQGQ